MSTVFGKNIQNLGGGSVGLGLSPAIANINMANNSIINLNQINGQGFPAIAGASGQILHIDSLGSMYWSAGTGATGVMGPTGPAQVVGGLCGQITFNWDVYNDGVGDSVGDSGLTYDWCAQVTNICAARILRNISVGGNANVVGTISSGTGENWIGNVKLSSGSISNQVQTYNNIGNWVLSSNSFFSPSMSITVSGSIYTPATISSSIAGVYMSNTTLSAGNSTIGGLGLSNSILTTSGMTVNGSAFITSATTISGLLTVSAAVIQNNLSVGGTFSNTGIATFLSSVGVGGSPTYTLDVQTTSAGSNGMRIAQNNTSNVTAGLYLEAGFGSGGMTSGNTTLVSFATRGGGGGTVVQSVMSIYEGANYGLSIKNGNTISSETFVRVDAAGRRMGVGTVSPASTLDVSGTGNFSSNVTIGGALNISGLATISAAQISSNLTVCGAFYGTTANVSAITGLSNINSIPFVGDSGNSNILFGPSVQTLSATNVVAIGTEAAYNVSGSNIVALGQKAAYNASGSNIVAIGNAAGSNNLGTNVVLLGANAGYANSNVASNVIAIGNAAAYTNASSGVIAIGSNAGNGNIHSNTIYLGNTTGYSGPGAPNTMIMYSTNAAIPFLYGDLSGRRLALGKTTAPTAALDVQGSIVASDSVTASGGLFTNVTASGYASINTLYVPLNATISGVTTLSSTVVQGTLSATTLFSTNVNTTTLSATGLASLSGVNVTSTLSAVYLFSSNGLVNTLSATTLSVSGTLTTVTLNTSGTATISAATVLNTLGTSNIISTLGTVTTLSVATFSVSALSTLTNVNVTSTLSSVYLFSSNGVINTLSALTANVSGAFTVSGLSTLSNVNVLNTLSSAYLFSSNGVINTFSAATANISGTFSVSGLSTLSNVAVQNTLSSSYISSTNAVITGLSSTTLYAGSLTVSGITVLPNLSGLMTFDGIPILLNTLSRQICFGVNMDVRGSDIITLGLSAAWKTSGNHVTGIGCNAVTNNSGNYVIAIGDDTGSSNIGCNVIVIGQRTGWSNIGSGVIAIGDGACTTGSGANAIGIGSNAGWSNTGSNMIGIGIEAGKFNTGNSGIFIGCNAGSNNSFSNALVLGNNPSGAYAITKPNTFLVYSTLCTAPFLQGDMSGILFGIGKVPTTTLDVSGSALITRNLTVSGTATISSAILTNLTVSGTTTLSALTTSSFTGSGLTTLSALSVQSTISTSNIYVSGATGIKLETNAALTMNSTFSNQGTSTLGGTSVTSLNNLTWPTGTQTVGSVLTICAGATGAYWAVPGAVSLSGWWNVAPTAPLSMNSYGITNLPSINGVQINLNSNYNFIGIGKDALSGSITGNDIIAIGLSAGIGATKNNLIYLGKNPGGTQAYDNWFTVYSTTSGLPFLQGDMSNMYLGIGKTPSVALDVSGSAAVSRSLNVSGLTTLSNATTATLSATTIYSSGTINSSGTATLNAVSIPTTLGVTGTSTLGTTNTGSLTASSVSGNMLWIGGQTSLASAVLSSTLNVTGVSTLARVDGQAISGTSLTTTGTLEVTGTSTLGTTNVSTLSATGLSKLTNTTATTLSATTLVALSTLNATAATTTLSATTVNTTLNVCGATNLSSAVLSQNLTVCGQTLFNNLSFSSLNSLTWAAPTAPSTVLSVDSTSKALSWVSLTTIGLQNWAQSKANSTLSLEGYGLTGITSFNNISAVFISASSQVGLGLGVLANNPASNIVAFGTRAGEYPGNPAGAGIYSNNMFLGSNPGGSCNVSNSLVIYSQKDGSPLIYGDLSKNQVAIAGQSTGGYTLNVNGSAQAATLNVTNAAGVGSLTVTGATTLNTLSATSTSTLAGLTATSLTNTGVTNLCGSLTTSGTARFVSSVTVNGATNVGLTGTPSNYRLNIAGTGGTTAFTTFYNSSVGVPYVGIGYDASLDGLSMQTNYGTTDFNRTALFIARSCNVPYVGIQNTNPQYPLDVSGVGNFASNVIVGGTFSNTGTATFGSKVGVGASPPTYTLDVQTSTAGSNGMRIARNDATDVTAGLYLEAGFGSGGMTSGNTTLVSFATRGGGGGTVVQSLMSIYEGSDYGLSIKAGNTVSSTTVLRVHTGLGRVGVGTVSPGATLDVSGTFNVSGATTLSGVSLNVLNGVRWPGAIGTAKQQLMINDQGTSAVWADPGEADAALWSCNKAVKTVNMNGFGLTGLASINGLTTTICSVTNQIGIGANILGNNTAASVVAFGSNAGSNSAANSTWCNCVYLGSNPGTTAGGSDTFLVYSTTATTPALQVNMASRQLGVGMVPSNALDVTGAARISTTLTSVGNVTIGTIASPSNYSLNINGATTTGMIAFYSTAANPQPQFGIGFDKTAGGLAIKTNNAGTDFTGTAMFITAGGSVGIGNIAPSYPLDVTGQINTSVRFSSPSTSSNSIGGITLSSGTLTAGTTTLGNTTAGTFSGTSLTSTGTLSVTGTSTLAGVTATSISNTGLSTLTTVSATTISGTLVYSSGAINAGTTFTAQTSVSTAFVNTTTLSAAGAVTVSGTFTTNSVANLSGTTTITGKAGVGASNTSTYPLMVTGTLYCTSNIISTLNVAGVTSGTSITLTTDNATTYYSLTTTTGTTLTLTLPVTPPPQGTYWVLKNNAAVNYTFTSTNGVFNAGSNSYYLQAGIGITLAYSGTLANGSPAYYTF